MADVSVAGSYVILIDNDNNSTNAAFRVRRDADQDLNDLIRMYEDGTFLVNNGAGGARFAISGSTGAVTLYGDLAASNCKITGAKLLQLQPQASDPGSATGDLWYDSGSNTLKVRLPNGVVRVLAFAPDVELEVSAP